MRRLAAAALTALLLAGCAAGGGGPRDRFYRSLAPRANPTAVIATELAFARAAKDKGQWTAFREFAADGALIFGANGAFEAQPWLKAQQDPAQSVAWEPHALWSSCDGSLAVTQGGYREPGGAVGAFYTVWQRQRDDEYEWVFDFAYPTEAAPATPETISAEVADCEASDTAVQADPAMALRTSRDGTLGWSFLRSGEGTRRFAVWQAKDGAMQQVIDAAVPPATR